MGQICKENKYDRHSNNMFIQETAIPQYPSQIVYIDGNTIEGKSILTAIDKLAKYAQAKIFNSRAAEDKNYKRTIVKNTCIQLY